VQSLISKINKASDKDEIKNGVNKCLDENKERIDKFMMIGINSSELLLSLVEDVLNLSKFESNNFTIQKSDFSIKEMPNEVTDIFKFQCEAKRLNFIVDIRDGLQNHLMFSDKQRIKQTLINLLSNSYKFTFEGYIKILVKKWL
jgi:signal transduction histidine kinase